MKKKGMLVFVVIFTIAFALLVSIKFFDRNKKVQLNSEFSLEKNQLVTVANKDFTNIKLVSIDNSCMQEVCDSDSITYKLLVNGKEHLVSSIPTTVNIYDDGLLEVIDGDDDRLVLKVVEN